MSPATQSVLGFLLFLVLVFGFDALFRRRSRQRCVIDLDESADDALKSMTSVAARRRAAAAAAIPIATPSSEDTTPVITLVPRSRGTQYQEIRRRAGTAAGKKP